MRNDIPTVPSWKGPFHTIRITKYVDNLKRTIDYVLVFTNMKPSLILQYLINKELFGRLSEKEQYLLFFFLRQDYASLIMFEYLRYKNRIGAGPVLRDLTRKMLLKHTDLKISFQAFKTAKVKIEIHEGKRSINSKVQEKGYMTFSYSESKRKTIIQEEPVGYLTLSELIGKENFVSGTFSRVLSRIESKEKENSGK